MSASLPPPRRQAYRVNSASPPRTSNESSLLLQPPPEAGSSTSAVAVDALSSAEMDSHLAAFDTLGPPGATRRPTRRVRSIERTWTWVRSRSSVYGEANLVNGDLDDELEHELGISRPMTMAATGNMNFTPASPRRNSTDVETDERRRRRKAHVDSAATSPGAGLRPPPRRPLSRSFTTPVAPNIELNGASDSSLSNSSSGPSKPRGPRAQRGLGPRDKRERLRPMPIFPAGPEDDSPPGSAYYTPTEPSNMRAMQSMRTASSIHDIVRRHTPAVTQASENVKDRARAELALRTDLLRSSPTKSPIESPSKTPTRVRSPTSPARSPLSPSPRFGGRRSTPPPAPPRIDTTPGSEPTKNQTPTSYSSHHRRQSSRSTTLSSDASDSYVNEIRLARAAYDQLTPRTPTGVSVPLPAPTPPPASFVPPPTRTVLSPTPEQSPKAKPNGRDRNSPDIGNRSNTSLMRSKSSSPLPQEDDSHAIALYLRSPQLNKNLLIARSGERPLQVSLADLGKSDGRPVVVFLGLGCVRYLIALYDELARALGLRIICIDRWGLGKTDQIPQNRRGLLDWADVVRRVLDELGIDRFQVLAHSAGAPYALATVLKMEQRVQGKIHLLAPWVGGDVEGYRWLKWVPNGVIKSALAAEWRLESYFLGKAPTIKNNIRNKSEATVSSTSLDSNGTSRASFSDLRPGIVEVDGFDTLATDLIPAPSGWTTSQPVAVHSVSSSPGFTQALMQASHAESLSGTTADLLSVVLGRDAKPWGFSYTDIRHPCKIWYGAEDERVAEKSMRWMERAMDAELLVVPSEGHNLMSSRSVMYDVLDSLAEDRL